MAKTKANVATVVPTHRHRSKSAPAQRGRSPDPRSLKKAAKEAKQKSKEFCTPPPKLKAASPGASDASSTKRKFNFGPDKVTPIQAENPAPKDMGIDEANRIVAALKDPHDSNMFYRYMLFFRCSVYIIPIHFQHFISNTSRTKRSRMTRTRNVLVSLAHRIRTSNRRCKGGKNGGPSLQYQGNLKKQTVYQEML